MSNSKFGTIVTVALGFIILYLLIDNHKKGIKIKQLQKDLDDNENLTKEIKKKLTELIKNNQDVNPLIRNELGQIVALLEIKQDSTAILKMAKIIENLLKELYKGDPELKLIAQENNRKKAVFADYLELAKKRKILSSEDFHLVSVMKIIRNEEAHELDIKKEKSRVLASFISGISFIIGLCGILKKKSLDGVQ